MAEHEFLILGRVVKTHGVHGEVKVECFADSWQPFRTRDRLWVGPSGGPYRAVTVVRTNARGGSVILGFAGVSDPETASGLVGYEVAIPRAEAPPLPEGAFYHSDIVGLAVEEAGRHLGIVREILETPAHDVYVVRGPLGEWMLPATRSHVRRIDLAAGRIDIEPGTDIETATSGGEESPEAV